MSRNNKFRPGDRVTFSSSHPTLTFENGERVATVAAYLNDGRRAVTIRETGETVSTYYLAPHVEAPAPAPVALGMVAITVPMATLLEAMTKVVQAQGINANVTRIANPGNGLVELVLGEIA